MTEHRTIPERLAALPDALRAEVERGLGQTTADPLLQLAEDVARLCRWQRKTWPLSPPLPPPWTPTEEAIAVEGRAAGMTCQQIAETLTSRGYPRTARSVQSRLSRVAKKRQSWTEKEDARVDALVEKGRTIAQIAARLRRSRKSVARRLERRGVSHLPRTGEPTSGRGRVSSAEIADRAGVDVSTVARWARESGARQKGSRWGVEIERVPDLLRHPLRNVHARLDAQQAARVRAALAYYEGGAE